MEPVTWLPLFPPEAEAPFLRAVAYWTRRGFAAGRASCGCADSLTELRRRDPDAAAFVETTAATLAAVPTTDRSHTT